MQTKKQCPFVISSLQVAKHDLVVATGLQHDDAFEALADMPGVNKDAIHVKVKTADTEKLIDLSNI